MNDPVRPADHPEFFRLPPPEGRSRESTIRIDRAGRFFHDGQEVEHPKLRRALATWISRHPDDGRYILTNGYDWTYFEVEDVPFFVRSVRDRDGELILELSDGTEEALHEPAAELTEEGGIRLRVKHASAGGPYDAKLTGAALVDLSPFLKPESDGSFVIEHGALRAIVRPAR